jgi:hypothetical protein
VSHQCVRFGGDFGAVVELSSEVDLLSLISMFDSALTAHPTL